MGILRMWREARGVALRKDYGDIMARMHNANQYARSAFLNNINQTIEATIDFYNSGSKSERKAFLKQSRKNMQVMWGRGDWPSALGLAISLLNAESHFVPGEDATYVKLETDLLIKEAAEDARRFRDLLNKGE